MKFLLGMMAVSRILVALFATAGILAAHARADEPLPVPAPAVPGPVVPSPPTPPYLGGLTGSVPDTVQRDVGFPPGWVGFGHNCLSLAGASAYCLGNGDLHPPTVQYPIRFP